MKPEDDDKIIQDHHREQDQIIKDHHKQEGSTSYSQYVAEEWDKYER